MQKAAANTKLSTCPTFHPCPGTKHPIFDPRGNFLIWILFRSPKPPVNTMTDASINIVSNENIGFIFRQKMAGGNAKTNPLYCSLIVFFGKWTKQFIAKYTFCPQVKQMCRSPDKDKYAHKSETGQIHCLL